MDKLPEEILHNEHILNFYDLASPPTLPEWLPDDLRLIMGAGDLDQNDILNVILFKEYDVFYCQPWDNNGSLLKNIEYLLENYNKQKVICFINHGNPEQVRNFKQIFQKRFILIDGFGGHCPHFDLVTISELLKIGGQAVNIFERSPGVITLNELLNCINENLPYCKDKLLYHLIEMENWANLEEMVKNKIMEEKGSTAVLPLDNIKGYTWLTYILYAVLFAKDLPVTMSAEVRKFSRSWQGARIELVLTLDKDYESILRNIDEYGTKVNPKESIRLRKLLDSVMKKTGSSLEAQREKYLREFLNNVIYPALRNGGGLIQSRRKRKTRKRKTRKHKN
jgi:hypothetical protein